MRPSTILDKAVKSGLPYELALALFARIAQAGIMPLAHVTYGAKNYDLRYRADYDRLDKFLAMSAPELLLLLSPIKAAGEDKYAGAGKKCDESPRAETEKMPAVPAVAAQNFHDWDFYDSALDISSADKTDKFFADGFAEDAAPLLQSAGITPLVADDSAEAEIFSESSHPHTEGTFKHEAVAAKLRNELSPVFSLHGVPIFKFDHPIQFKLPEKSGWGQFNKREVDNLNRMMKKLIGSDIVLVEYNIPVIAGMQGVRKRIDVVAFNSETRILKIIDWKFGSYPVTIDDNPQLKSYVQCLLKDVFINNNVDWIEVYLVQPNWQGIKLWESSKDSFF